MADTTYTPKTYRKSGGDVLVIASGGEQQVESGGQITVASGGVLKIGTSTFTAGTHQVPKVIKQAVAGVVATTGGAIAAIANPEGATVIILRCLLNRTTKSTGAATADIGVAANGTTTSDTLIDGLNIAAAEALADNVTDGGTNGKARQLWSSSQFVTVTGSADSTGLVGVLYIEYVLA